MFKYIINSPSNSAKKFSLSVKMSVLLVHVSFIVLMAVRPSVFGESDTRVVSCPGGAVTIILVP